MLVVELRGNLGIPGESGNSLRKTTNGIYGSTNCAITADLKITITTCDDYFGSIHTHPYPGAVPMFSWEVVYSLVKFYECCSFNNNEEITIYLVTKDASGNFQTYSLIIDNIDTFADAIVDDVQRITPNMTLEANTRNVIDALDEEMKFDIQILQIKNYIF